MSTSAAVTPSAAGAPELRLVGEPHQAGVAPSPEPVVGPVAGPAPGPASTTGRVLVPGWSARQNSAVQNRAVQNTVPGSVAAPRIVPVPESLAGLFPWRGMRRGSVVSVQGSASLLFALMSTASAAGSWAAVVGREDLGLLAAAEAGVEVRRLALVPRPGVELAAVANALLDGMELVALAGVERLTSAEVRRLSGRARQRGSVLLPLGDWPGADVRLRCERIEWSGLGDGYGRLRSMRMTVRAVGRGASARPRVAEVELPASQAPERTAGQSSGRAAGRTMADGLRVVANPRAVG